MTIQEALETRIPRIRKPQWGNPHAYLRLPLYVVGHGPWAELYDDVTQEQVLSVRPGSQRVLCLPSDDDGFEVYDGPVSPFEAHPKNFAQTYAPAAAPQPEKAE